MRSKKSETWVGTQARTQKAGIDGKSSRLLLMVLMAAILLSSLSLGAWRRAGSKVTRVRSPAKVASPGPFIHNGVVGIWPDRVYYGIIDLFYFESRFQSGETGGWRQFNNVVPVAATRLFINNAEMEHVPIAVEVLEHDSDRVRAKLHVGRFSNGIALEVMVTLVGVDIRMEVFPTKDSARVRWLTLGTYAGFFEWPSEVDYGGGVLRVDDLKPPPDGHLKPGRWITIPSDDLGDVVKISSERPLVQTMRTLPGPGARDRLEVEIRANPWLPTLPTSDRPWFEAVQLVREPFSLERNVWVFSVTAQR